MQKLDLHVTSVPDHRAQIAIAKIISDANHTISLQLAVEMAKSPPLLLFHNIDPKTAEQHINRLKELGIGFEVSIVKPMPKAPPPSDLDLSDFSGIKAHNEGIDKSVPEKPAPPIPPVQPAARPVAPIELNEPKEPPKPSRPTNPIELPSRPQQAGTGRNQGFTSGGTGLAAIREKERQSKQKTLLVTAVIAGVLLIFTVLMFMVPTGSERFMPKTHAPAPQQEQTQEKQAQKQGRAGSQTAGQAAVQTQAEAQTQTSTPEPAQQPSTTPTMPGNDSPDKLRSRVSSQSRLQSSTYVDSARTAGDNLDNVISFYRIAISFNRYNLAAWQGLLQAYRDTGMTREARETEEQMRAIFGDTVTSVSDLIKPFGEVVDTYKSEDGTYRVEYRSHKRSRAEILNEVFNMTRSVRSACGCANISIFASTGAGRGMIAHSTPATSIHTLSAFSNQAQIIWLD